MKTIATASVMSPKCSQNINNESIASLYRFNRYTLFLLLLRCLVFIKMFREQTLQSVAIVLRQNKQILAVNRTRVLLSSTGELCEV